VTASFGTLAWPPVSGSLGQASSVRSSGQHISPHQAAGCSKDQNQRFGHLRTLRADLVELALNRLLGDSLFHDHRIAAIHLRNSFPCRYCVERLASPECLDQCLSLARHFLAEFWLCRRRSGLNQKIAKVCVIASPAPSRRGGDIGFRRSRPFGRLCSPVAFHIHSSLSRIYLRPSSARCRTQSRFSPSIARSQYSPTSRPLGFCSDRLSTSSLTWNSLTTLSMVSLCS
jgi:hypothetical protein